MLYKKEGIDWEPESESEAQKKILLISLTRNKFQLAASIKICYLSFCSLISFSI